MAKASELREMNDELLAEQLRNARLELFNLRFANASGELENTARLTRARRDLARALTVVRERGIDLES